MLSEILEAFFAREAAVLGERAMPRPSVLVLSRARQAVRVLQQNTIDAFSSRTPKPSTDRRRSCGICRLVSHEIRQPLGVLQVLARVLPVREGDENPPALSNARAECGAPGRDRGQAERLARLTRRTDTAPNEQQVDLAAVAQDVAGQLRDMADARGVGFEVDPQLPTVAADAHASSSSHEPARQCRHTRDPTRARVSSVERDGNEACPRVRIRDNGIGSRSRSSTRSSSNSCARSTRR
jgi:light-regulated signal transduction histidine kinase (bacteriophytochrome)